MPGSHAVQTVLGEIDSILTMSFEFQALTYSNLTRWQLRFSHWHSQRLAKAITPKNINMFNSQAGDIQADDNIISSRL